MNTDKFAQISAQMAELDLEFQELCNVGTLFDPRSIFNEIRKKFTSDHCESILSELEREYGRRSREIVTEFNDLLRLSWNA